MLEMNRVRVLFFSVLRDLTGSEEVEVEMEDGARLGVLMERLFERWPRLREWDASLLLAVNQDYVGRDAVLVPGCEVAVMPPVQGG
jgi:molybdopterin converting factor subunit 1